MDLDLVQHHVLLQTGGPPAADSTAHRWTQLKGSRCEHHMHNLLLEGDTTAAIAFVQSCKVVEQCSRRTAHATCALVDGEAGCALARVIMHHSCAYTTCRSIACKSS
jgi:hypothetical protein